MRLRFLLGAAVGAALCSAAVAGAVTITDGSKPAGSGAVAVSSCETSTLTFPRRAIDNTSSHNVTNLMVANIDAACSGATISVELVDGSGNGLAGGSTTVSGGSVRVTFPTGAPAASVRAYVVALAGA
jgi:hypothetical protein